MTLSDQVTAAVRTAAAGLASLIITFLLNKGFDFPEDVDVQINVLVFLAVMAGWNLLVNFLATKVNPWFGVLLIVPKQPTYTPAPKPAGDGGAVSVLEIALIVLIVVLIVLLLT